MNYSAAQHNWILFHGKRKICRRFAAVGCLLLILHRAEAAPLMEEGFDYPGGTALAANPPWSGSIGPSLEVGTGNLTLTNLQGTSPAGNLLQIGGGGSVFAYRNFSTNPVVSAEGTAVYLSALVNCTLLPTNRQFIACMMEAGANSPNAPNDPVDLYMTPGSGGCRLAIRSEGSDSATASTVLTTNTTHFIVMKYTFGSNDFASLYIDPVPGAPEPAFADAQTGGNGGGGDDDGGGGDAANLQVVFFQSPNFAAQGGINFDTLRAGTNWMDVTPVVTAPSITGPQNLAVCFGDPAVFSVNASGLPPFSYQWRTNGGAIQGATNNIYAMPTPTAADALNSYDVVVGDVFGSVTSRVASLAVSYSTPGISMSPTNPIVMPGASNATFDILVSGDAPLNFQWRTNGIAVPGATNNSYTITSPGPADATNEVDFVVSNPCGSTTSAPPVEVSFYNQFCSAFDAGAGFFSGENLILTNASGTSLYVWSSPDPSVPVTNWTLEGPMSELPLGTTGYSRYDINLNPVTSPVYYIFAQTNTGSYTAIEPVFWLTTPDFASYYLTSSEMGINADGIFEFPVPPVITQQPQSQAVLAGQNASFNVTATGFGLGYQWFFNDPGMPVSSTAMLGLTNLSAINNGNYFVVVTNSLGAATSAVATLTVTLPPALQIGSIPPGTVQFTANTITNLTYVIQSATNLVRPVWVSILTNNTGLSGLVFVQTNITDTPWQFYRLFFPSAFPLPPLITQQPQSQTALAGQSRSFIVSANDPGAGYQWFFYSNGFAGASAPVLNLINIAATNAGAYVAVITNRLGAMTSSVATLTVVLPPSLNLTSGTPGTIQFNANSITGLTYVVQLTTNLVNPAWVSIRTNNTGNGGAIYFQTNTTGATVQFYRLLFP